MCGKISCLVRASGVCRKPVYLVVSLNDLIVMQMEGVWENLYRTGLTQKTVEQERDKSLVDTIAMVWAVQLLPEKQVAVAPVL
jgi:hypothetical protein